MAEAVELLPIVEELIVEGRLSEMAQSSSMSSPTPSAATLAAWTSTMARKKEERMPLSCSSGLDDEGDLLPRAARQGMGSGVGCGVSATKGARRFEGRMTGWGASPVRN